MRSARTRATSSVSPRRRRRARSRRRLSSAASFTVGAALPLLVVVLFDGPAHTHVSAGSLLFLALLGAISARAGGADMVKGAVRVTFWGALAMAVTAGVGALVGTAV